MLTKLARAWLLMWGLSYIIVAAIAPGIAGDIRLGQLTYGVLGLSIIGALILFYYERNEEEPFPGGGIHVVRRRPYVNTARFILCVLGYISVCGGVASWTGLAVWHVPFENQQAIFQVSMAFANLLSAVFMFALAWETDG